MSLSQRPEVEYIEKPEEVVFCSFSGQGSVLYTSGTKRTVSIDRKRGVSGNCGFRCRLQAPGFLQ